MTRSSRWSRQVADEPFFREWNQRAPGERRSLGRAWHFAETFGLTISGVRPLGVVGSKGKGTAASYAAATLHRAGRDVGLITSPGYRTNRERIRHNGVAISPRELERLASRVAEALAAMPCRETGSGYLSPNGAFLVAGLAWLTTRGCDSFVVEAGKGGASDELSLTQPSVVAFTPIFEEHVGILGDTLSEIAAEKAGVVTTGTRLVVSAPQCPTVGRIVTDVAAEAGARLTCLAPQDASGLGGLDHLPVLLRMNAALGIRAGLGYLDPVEGAEGRQGTGPPLDVPRVSLPGRASVHRRNTTTWVLDSAINAAGVAAVFDWCRATVGEPSTVLLSIPNPRELAASLQVVDHPRVQPTQVEAPHLTWTTPRSCSSPFLGDLDVSSLGELVLAVGTLSFVGEILDMLDVDTTRLF